MRKEDSAFITKFRSESGNFKKNRDFTGFVTLDDFACWVIADGIDTSDEKLSAEMAVSSIISDFTTKPGFSKSLLKKYINNANSLLKEYTGKMELSASMMIVISDYRRIMYGYAGNTRMYQLRKDKIVRKTQDHSIARLMADVEDIDKNLISKHKDRNTLYNYFGKEKTIKPEISGKIKLMNDDVILLGSAGMWENLEEKDIGEILKGSMNAEEFVENIEDVIKDNNPQNLNNYSIMTIFIQKLYSDAEAKKKKKAEKPARKINFGFLKNKTFQKIAAVILVLAIGAGIFAIKKARDKKIAAMKKEMALKKQEEEADKSFDGGDYSESMEKYEKSREIYKNNPEKLKEIDAKIEKLKMAMSAKDLEKEGDKNFSNENFGAALSKYSEAISVSNKAEIKDISGLEEKMNQAKESNKIKSLEKSGDNSFSKQDYDGAMKIYQSLISNTDPDKYQSVVTRVQGKTKAINEIYRAIDLEESADEMYKMEKYSEAKEKYQSALAIYQENDIEQKQKEMNRKLNEIEQVQIYGDIMEDAKKLEEDGDNLLEKKNFEKAEAKYQAAKSKYDKIENSEKISLISEKLEKIKFLKKYETGKTAEEDGDKLLEDKKYDKSIEKYENAKKIFNDLNKPEDYNRADEKLKKAKKKKKILGIF